jgi:parallel beta-helix repeat protein
MPGSGGISMIRRASILFLCCGLAACGSTSTNPTPVTPTPTPAPSPTVNTTLTSCASISASANYTVAADMGGNGTSACIQIAGSNLVLDCAGHSVGALSVLQNLSNLTIKNCRLGNILAISNGNNITIDHNTFVITGVRPAAAIYLVTVNNSQITNNTIDGGYHGQDLSGGGTDGPGADDGVVLGDATNDLVSGNTISNVFDAGVEGVNHVSSCTISNNTITNAVFTGIGAYYCTAWTGNIISGNTVSQSLSFIEGFVLTRDLCSNFPNRPGQAVFVGNTITNNVMRNPIGNSQFGISLLFTPPAGMASGNSISGNDMGLGGIAAQPPAGYNVGAGNKCGPSGNFTC